MGVNINTRTAPGSNGAVTDTGQLFLVGPFGAGPQDKPAECHSIPDFEAAIGVRSVATAAWDYADFFFREGGNTLYALDYATTGQYTAALALLTEDLGAGQVAVVGEPATSGLYTALQAHADALDRIALLDVLSTDNTDSALEAEGTLAQALASKENIGLFGSWVTGPAAAGVIGGSTRQVPASAVIAALCNRVDQGGNPNQPAGGRDFPLQYATGFVYDPVAKSSQSALKAKGVNFFHDAWGVLENYGFLTPLYTGSPSVFGQTPFAQLNCSRARMWLKWQAKVIGENYYMKDIDGKGVLAGRLEAQLRVLCNDLYELGGLYDGGSGNPDDAYNVNVGVSVNNTGTVAQAQLNAVAQCRFSQYADSVNITLVSVPVTGVIS